MTTWRVLFTLQHKKLEFGKAVRISWVDSKAYGGWQYGKPSQIGEVAKVQSLGWVLDSNKESILLTTSIGETGAMLNPLQVPWAAITSLEVLPDQFNRV